MAELPTRGVLRVVSGAQMTAAEQAAAEEKAAAQAQDKLPETTLASFIRSEFDMMKRHRNMTGAGWTERLLHALRVFNGQYDATKLAEIERFGGSKVYARVVAMKCRGASSLLNDVYLSPTRPWGLDAPADPTIPQNIIASVQQLVMAEMQSLIQAGQQPDIESLRDRTMQLMEAARQAAKKKARQQAQVAEDRIQEMLDEGGFYKALAEFLVDLPLFPFAVIKGPTVRILPSVDWQEGKAIVSQKPRFVWSRISPFDVWWTPGASDIEDAAVIERTKLTRADLNDLLDLPGYDHDAVRAVLDEYGRGGIHADWDMSDTERAVNESRENPFLNRSGMITCLEYHGNVQGRVLIEQGISPDQIPDELRDYFIQAWLIGPYIIKVQLSPSPRKRHPYFITSFEKVPGTPVGNGLPDMLADVQESANATLRSLINNMSIASGPQVTVNDDRLSSDEDGEELYPWKRWHVRTDPMGNNGAPPITFFQPNSNAQELFAVYQQFVNMADELSAIPKYLQGSGAGGGAGRTASGLAMLMGNASKLLQTVAANVDRDVMRPMLSQLFDMILLTDTTGLLTGEESIKVMGVSVAVQRETQRSRQLEFLQITANPMDAQIVGPKGRAAVLREVAQGLGLPGEEIVPSEDQLEAMEKQQQAMAAMAAQAQGGQAPQGGNVNGDTGPRTNIAGGQ